jgi:ribosomal protein S18 acetylase RimI-like enzyme
VTPVIHVRAATRPEDDAALDRLSKKLAASEGEIVGGVFGGGFIVAEDRNGIIGMVSYWGRHLDENEMGNLYVEDTHRRRGIGRVLVSEVVRLARENGETTLDLEVRRGNVAALYFYQRLGFHMVSADATGMMWLRLDLKDGR